MQAWRGQGWLRDVAGIVAFWAIILQAALGPLAAARVMAADPLLAASICRPAIAPQDATGADVPLPVNPEHHDHAACSFACPHAPTATGGVCAILAPVRAATVAALAPERRVRDRAPAPVRPSPARGPPSA